MIYHFRNLSNYYLRIAKVYLEKNFDRRKAFENLILAVAKRPLNGNAWVNLGVSGFPRSLIRWWKRKRYELWDRRKTEVLKNVRPQEKQNAEWLGENGWKE